MRARLRLRERLWLRPLRGCPRLVIVAHPDDETLWAGATIASEPGAGVLCLTNRSVRARRSAFQHAMRALGAVGVIFDVPDRRSEPPTAFDIDRMTSAVRHVLLSCPSAAVFTHGPEGEYGHVMHQRVSAVVTTAAEELGADLWYFDFADPEDPTDLGLGVPEAKARAFDAYFPPDREIPESDAQHMRLSALERPTRASDYQGLSPAVAAIYGSDGA